MLKYAPNYTTNAVFRSSSMKKIIPITDLQRQSGRIVSDLAEADEPVISTQRGRAAAVLLSAERYSQIEEDLARLDDRKMLGLIERGLDDFAQERTLTNKEVRSKLEKKHAAAPSRKRKTK